MRASEIWMMLGEMDDGEQPRLVCLEGGDAAEARSRRIDNEKPKQASQSAARKGR